MLESGHVSCAAAGESVADVSMRGNEGTEEMEEVGLHGEEGGRRGSRRFGFGL